MTTANNAWRTILAALAAAVCLTAAHAAEPRIKAGGRDEPNTYPVRTPLPEEVRPAQRVAFPEIKNWNSLRMRLERIPAYSGGARPGVGYFIEVCGDGTVTYVGGFSAAVLGVHHARLSQDEVRALFAAFKRADFFWLNRRYDVGQTHAPADIVELEFDGMNKKVSDSYGIEAGMPILADDLAAAILDYTGAERWIYGNEETAQSFVDEHWDFSKPGVGNEDMIPQLARGGDPEVVRDVIALRWPNKAENRRPNKLGTSLPEEAVKRDIAMLDAMLERPWPQIERDEALLAAAYLGWTRGVKRLLAAGANASYFVPPGAPRPRGALALPGIEKGFSVLMAAARSWSPRTVTAILRTKPPLEARNADGRTALMLASNIGDEMFDGSHKGAQPAQTVQRLIDAGANVNARDKDGNTPLHFGGKFFPVTAVLVANGGDPAATNARGVPVIRNCVSISCMVLNRALRPDPRQPVVAYSSLVDPDAPMAFPEIRDWKTLVVSLHRGGEKTPFYTVEITGEGAVFYQGYSKVAVGSQQRGALSMEAVRALFGRFRSIDFFRLKTKFGESRYGKPYAHLRLRYDGYDRTIRLDGADHGAPQAIVDLMKAVDSAAGSERWVVGSAAR